MAAPKTTKTQPAATEAAPAAPVVAPAQKYAVDLVLANDGAGGNSSYCVELTGAQILRLLSDTDSPRWIRLPAGMSMHVPGGEYRYVATSQLAEVHVGRGWEPPHDAWEWLSPEERASYEQNVLNP